MVNALIFANNCVAHFKERLLRGFSKSWVIFKAVRYAFEDVIWLVSYKKKQMGTPYPLTENNGWSKAQCPEAYS